MKLNSIKRVSERKSDAKKLRNLGKIPAIIYSHGKDSELIAIDTSEYDAMLRGLKKGHLPTTVITLVDESGKERKVLIKDIQYKVTTYRVIHMDFEELLDDVKIKVNVPIECIGEVDCVGIKLGGVLRRVIRYLRVQCLPKDLPSVFEMDVETLGLKQSRKLGDLTIPDFIRPLADLNEVAVIIAKR